jgi:hypothetical protein
LDRGADDLLAFQIATANKIPTTTATIQRSTFTSVENGAAGVSRRYSANGLTGSWTGTSADSTNNCCSRSLIENSCSGMLRRSEGIGNSLQKWVVGLAALDPPYRITCPLPPVRSHS